MLNGTAYRRSSLDRHLRLLGFVTTIPKILKNALLTAFIQNMPLLAHKSITKLKFSPNDLKYTESRTSSPHCRDPS